MTTRKWVRLVAVMVLATLVLESAPVLAQSYDPADELPTPTLLEMRLNKLGRGLSNIFFGWTEIPLTWDRKMKQGKPLTYLLSVAPVMGVTRAGIRTGVGFYETFTFIKPTPELNYEPIVEPEFLF